MLTLQKFAATIIGMDDTASRKLQDVLGRHSLRLQFDSTVDHTFLWQICAVAILVLLGVSLWNHKLIREIRSRKQAQAALAESEQNLAITLNSIDDAVIATDQHGRVMRMNPTAERLTGWTLTEAFNQPLTDVFNTINTQTRLPSLNPVQRVMERGQVVRSSDNIALLGRHGREYLIAESAAPIRNAATDAVGVVLVFKDVTEKFQAEKAMQRLQTMMQRTESMAQLASFEWDIDADVVNWSPEMFRIFGRDPAQGIPNLAGQSELYTPESTQLLMASVHRAVNEGTPYEMELMTVQPDGEQRPCVVKGYPERDASGRVVRVTGLVQDVTERKALQEKLARNEKEFRFLAESIPQIVWITDANGWNIYFNQQWVRYTGLSLEESHGNGWNKPFHPDDQIIAWNAWKNAVKDIGHYSLECRLRRADGAYRWWLIQGLPVFNELGTVDKWFGTCTDIHDIKQAENELKAAAAVEREMASKNIQLSQELHKRNLDLTALTAHVQKIAEEERSKLARELHDELGSILVGLSMKFSHLSGKLSDPALSHDLSEISQLITDAASIKSHVISQLYPTILENFGLYAALEWQVREYSNHTGIPVTLVLPEVEFDMEHIYSLAAYRITQECLTNIAKHANASKVIIEGKVCSSFLNLTIYDNGKGFHDDKNIGGHGIFGMIERARFLGGSLEIRSTNDMGTTALLTLPLATIKPKSKKRVLLVDDHAIVRNAIRQLIEDQTDDFAIAGEAADGHEALQMGKSGEWDIVLLDINLPKMNGIKVLEEIKQVKPDLPVIILSSHTEAEYGAVAIAKGAACYIEKAKTDKLIEALRSAVATSTVSS